MSRRSIEQCDEGEILASVLEETKGDFYRELGNTRIVEFVSRSNGRGRKKRRWPREVCLLIYGDRAYPIINGELRQRKSGGIGPDRIAQEALAFLPNDEQTPDILLEIVRRKQKTW